MFLYCWICVTQLCIHIAGIIARIDEANNHRCITKFWDTLKIAQVFFGQQTLYQALVYCLKFTLPCRIIIIIIIIILFHIQVYSVRKYEKISSLQL